MKVVAGVFIQRSYLLELFDTLFPLLKDGIRMAYVRSQAIVNDQSERYGNDHSIDIQDFYEFLVRLSIIFVDENVPPFICLDLLLQEIERKLE